MDDNLSVPDDRGDDADETVVDETEEYFADDGSDDDADDGDDADDLDGDAADDLDDDADDLDDDTEDDDEADLDAAAADDEADLDAAAADDEADLDDDADDEIEADLDDTEFATVADGGTVEEAKATALEQLRKLLPSVREEDVEFVVLDEGGKGGFLGMGRSHPRVEARALPGAAAPDPDAPPLDEALDRLHEFLTTVIDGIGLDVDIDVSQDGEALVADVIGEDLGILIGRHGQTLDALQYLAAIVVNGHSRSRRQVVVDAEGYRGRREVSLKGVADRAAQKAERTRSDVTLKPMTASERKIIHVYLKDNPRVETHSEGDEPQRTVVVSPRRR